MPKITDNGLRLDDGTWITYRQMANNSQIRDDVMRILQSMPATYAPRNPLIQRLFLFQTFLNGNVYLEWTNLFDEKILYRHNYKNGLQKMENGKWVKSNRTLHEFLRHDNIEEKPISDSFWDNIS